MSSATRDPYMLLGVGERVTTAEIDAALAAIGAPSDDQIWAHKLLGDRRWRAVWDRYRDRRLLADAGFFADTGIGRVRRRRELPLLITTPTHKLTLPSDPNEPVRVLVTTGGFAPLHDGHLTMLAAARDALETRGMAVAGGFVSPSHDDYVGAKVAGDRRFGAEARLSAAQDALAGSDWLAVEPWEARHAGTAVNFTYVIDHLEDQLHVRLGRMVTVIYVFGGDNAGFVHAFANEGHAVCVGRPGWDDVLAAARDVVAEADCADRVLVISGDHTGASRDLRPALPEAAPSQPGVYAVRDDLAACTTHFGFDPDALDRFRRRILDALGESLGSQVDVRLVDLAAQRRALPAALAGRRSLSNDTWITGDASVAFSRRFAVSDGQRRHLDVGARPGAEKVEVQMAAVGSGDWVFVDDDIVTGTTRHAVEAALDASQRLVGSVSLLTLTVGDCPAPFDVVDLRDFVLGARHGGLAVIDPVGGRALYALPYVDLTARASIPPEGVLELSKRIWAANAELFATRANVTVADADEATATLLCSVGFAASVTLAEVCSWHLDALSRPALIARPGATGALF